MDPRTDNLAERSVVDLIVRRAHASVTEVAGELQLSASTAGGILSRLLDKGALSRREVSAGRRGRPTYRYELKLPAPLAAFLFDGTQIAATLFDTQLEPRASHVQQITQVHSPGRAVQLVRDVLARLCEDGGVARRELYGVAIAVNAVRTRGNVYTSSVLSWIDGTFESLLARELKVPTRLTSPPQLLAEYRLLPEPRPASMIYLHVADGVSGHWSAFGRSVRGGTNRAGELGHVVVDPAGPLCGCGRRGCLEALCSGPAIARQAVATIDGKDGAIATRELRTASPRIAIELLWNAWQDQDAFARSIIDPMLDRLARALGLAVNVVDPNLVVAGGYVLSGKPDWIEQIRQRALPWILHANSRPIDIVLARGSADDELRVIATQYHARVGLALGK